MGSQVREAGHIKSAEYRKRSPHANNREDEEDGTRQESQKIIQQKMRKKLVIKHGLKRLKSDKQSRYNQRICPYDQFQYSINFYQSEGFLDAVYEATGYKASQAQSPHEHSENSANSKRRASDDICDHPGPQDFIDQSRDAG